MKDKGLTKEEIGSILLAKKALSKLGHGSMINVKKCVQRWGYQGRLHTVITEGLREKRKFKKQRTKKGMIS